MGDVFSRQKLLPFSQDCGNKLVESGCVSQEEVNSQVFSHPFVVFDIFNIAYVSAGGQDEGQPDGSKLAASEGQRPVLGFNQVSPCQVSSLTT